MSDKMKVEQIALSQIEQNENSRVVYKNTDLAELILSMKKNGLMQPVGVRKLPSGKYDAVWGNRRILAAKKLGWDEIAAHVVDVDSDSDRDILGLIENLKRQNTSVAEDGRMFQSLLDRGLSISEIAARLDISPIRVQLGIDVIHNVPEEHRKKIVYATPGNRARLSDRIPASTAVALLNIRKTASLNREQTRQLFKFASESGSSIPVLQKIAPLVKSGVSISDAIKSVDKLQCVHLSVYLPANKVEKLEKKHGTSIQKILERVLLDNKTLGIIEMGKRGPLNMQPLHSDRVKAILRKAASAQ